MSIHSRRLPIYLVLDCSESMAGEAIEDVGRGVEALSSALRADPVAVEGAWLSVITFSRYARQVVPLTEVLHFQPPPLSVRTGSALGAALDLLKECIGREVVRTTPTTKGDYRPLVFLFTDGQPTDAWEAVADAIKRQTNPSIANIYAIACGPDVDTDVLRRVTDIVLQMKDMSSQGWRKVFVWLSASVRSVQSASLSREGAPSGLPPLPTDALEAAPASMGAHDPRPRQVFLHAYCSRTNQPYLMRFARRPGGKTYVALCAHKLGAVEEDGGDEAPTVHTSRLEGCPDCPYCGNPTVASCECKALFCVANDPEGTLVCPHCHQSGTYGTGAREGFEVGGSQG